jgi:hypothetical protein
MSKVNAVDGKDTAEYGLIVILIQHSHLMALSEVGIL